MQSNQPVRHLLPLVFLLMAPGVGADEADALNFFVGTNVVYDDNVFRLASGTSAKAAFGTDQRSDVIRTTFVGGSFDKLIGRQRLRLDMTLNSVHFEQFSQLDNNGGHLNGELDWRVTDDLSGSVGKNRNRSMPGYRDQRTLVKNILVVDNEFVTADLRLQPAWHLEAMASQVSSSNSAQANQPSDSTIDAYSLGVRFTPVTGNFIGVRNTWSKGRYPNLQFISGALVDNGFSQDEMALEASWALTGVSRLGGLVAYTERTHENVPQRNFSGVTGNAVWDWRPTGKLSMLARIRREIGAQNDLLSSYALTDACSLSSTWSPSAKTSLRLNYERAKRNFLGDPVAALSAIPKRRDKLDTLSLTATYQPMQSLSLSLSITSEKRDSNYAGYSYEDSIAMASAQFVF